MQPLILAIDFDGTIVKREEDYVPKTLLPNAKEVINWAHDKGCFIILWTCRPNEMLTSAINFLKANGIKYDAVNKNYEDLGMETSRKVFADYYIDDRSFEINWLQIKKKIIKEIFRKLVDEIIELSKDLKVV